MFFCRQISRFNSTERHKMRFYFFVRAHDKMGFVKRFGKKPSKNIAFYTYDGSVRTRKRPKNHLGNRKREPMSTVGTSKWVSEQTKCIDFFPVNSWTFELQ